MELQQVRRAYSSMSEQYIGLFDGGFRPHEADTAVVPRHLTGLPGPVLDLGCGPGHWTGYTPSLPRASPSRSRKARSWRTPLGRPRSCINSAT
jgi:hypothetical protein